jgi:hypothetical protein
MRWASQRRPAATGRNDQPDSSKSAADGPAPDRHCWAALSGPAEPMPALLLACTRSAFDAHRRPASSKARSAPRLRAHLMASPHSAPHSSAVDISVGPRLGSDNHPVVGTLASWSYFSTTPLACRPLWVWPSDGIKGKFHLSGLSALGMRREGVCERVERWLQRMVHRVCPVRLGSRNLVTMYGHVIAVRRAD